MARDSCQIYISSTALYTDQFCVPALGNIPPFIRYIYLYCTPQRILHIGLRIRYVYTPRIG